MKKTLKLLLTTSFIYMVLGVLSGLFYREFTKFNGSPGGTQLAVVHTHWLTLGAIVGLILLLLEIAVVLAMRQLGLVRRARALADERIEALRLQKPAWLRRDAE